MKHSGAGQEGESAARLISKRIACAAQARGTVTAPHRRSIEPLCDAYRRAEHVSQEHRARGSCDEATVVFRPPPTVARRTESRCW